MPFTNKGIFRLFIFLTGYILFLVIGGTLLAAIEEPSELKIIGEIRKLKKEFIESHNVSAQDLEEYSKELVRAATGRGVTQIGNNTNDLTWNFCPALFFASTLVTTIGYGQTTPKSESGKIFCILYAMVGIPLTLVLISAIVERLLFPTVWLLRVLNDKLGNSVQQFNIRLIHLGILLVILALFFYIIPAIIFNYMETKWDYLDAFYFCFLSLTTVGLGDVVPGDGGDIRYVMTYKIFVIIYLYLGIAFMMLTLAVFYDIPQLSLADLYQPDKDRSNQMLRLTAAVQGGPMPDSLSVRTYTSAANQKKKDSLKEGILRHVNYTSDDSSTQSEIFVHKTKKAENSTEKKKKKNSDNPEKNDKT